MAPHSGIGIDLSPVVPDAAGLRRAADVLNAGERVAMLVGAGALRATDEVIAVAERLGAGVAKALLGKAAVPDDVPFCTGSIGLLGTKASWDLMQGCRCRMSPQPRPRLSRRWSGNRPCDASNLRESVTFQSRCNKRTG